ncbi:hypothetical protein IGI04_030040 [Brassica rapa subsp. trilocularis]|uniref:Flotillin-like n=1 Tax=Brassica rapa subsp. trilocularis TaxID=1813537 RepID=A0ABQ7LSU3_BRACM|nr:hypothetical protein IGI04_030040 [Brassica rapa subsp. trilocularis]
MLVDMLLLGFRVSIQSHQYGISWLVLPPLPAVLGRHKQHDKSIIGCTCPEMAQTTMKSLCNRVCYSLIVLSLSINKKRVKDYAIKALVNKIDYLGSVTVTYKVNEFVDEKVDQVAGTELHHFLQFHLQLPYMYYIPEAEKALGGDLQPEQSPSSASKTGDSPSNAKEVDEANSPSLV